MSYPISDTEVQELTAASSTQFDIKKFVYKLIGFLPWIIISVLISYTVAQLYLRYTPKMYRVSANLLIKDDGESSTDYNLLQELGVTPGGREVQNQIDILQSYELAEAVVDSLNLQIKIVSQGRIASSTSYGKNSPLFIHLLANDTAQFIPSNYQLFVDDRKFWLQKGTEKTEYNFGDTFSLAGKKVSFERNDLVPSNSNGYNLIIQDKRQITVGLKNAIVVTKIHDNGAILEIAMLNESPDLAIDIINTLIEVFNIAAVKDKNIAGYKATRFVADRVDTVEKELDQLELQAEAFKRVNKITDIDAAGGDYLTQSHAYDNLQVEQTGTLEMLKALEKYIRESKNYTDIIPSEYGITEATLAGLIAQYNSQVQTYQEQIKISTPKDPILARLEDQITDIKENILKNIQSIKGSYEIKLGQIKSRHTEFDNKLASFPEKEREYLKLKRQIGVKEQLYLFLLQKKEETELALVSSSNDTRVVDPAFSQGVVSPKSDQVKLFAILIGVTIPILIMLLIDFFNNKISDRREIEDGTKIPILGELSFNNTLKSKIVHSKSRSSMAEQFRLIGTNLRYLATDEKCKMILVTSFMSGEGKSFVSINLASSLSAGNRKVLLIEMDLRKPKLAKYLNLDPEHGLSDYLINNLPYEKFITRSDHLPDVDIITCGPVPPNPAELLMHPRIEKLFEFAKENYKYIVIDSSPVGLVADVFLVSKYIDVTLFILRHKYSYKTTIQYVERLNADKKFNRLNLVVNSIKEPTTAGYRYGYGYSYGYGYGYSYAYGYGNDKGYHYGHGYYPDDEQKNGKKPSFFRMKKK
jgi:capsular exopolysaccharide synthesis family protein